jgi:N6-L-threonylcarbamoyladenine synthase
MLKVLGIESSCDDSAASIVQEDKIIISNVVISQIEEHSTYKGVVPEIAARSHMNNVEYAILKATFNIDIKEDIDAIAATCGPGLIGGVIVGSMYAKALCSALKKPFIAVNHLEGHSLTARLTSNLKFPYLLLLASGGHSQFVAVFGVGKYKILGRTLDDSAGEAFDKVAKLLDLGFPGGPIIEELARKGDPNKYKLPLCMKNRKGCDMSFSGLKTAVLLITQKNTLSRQDVFDLCATFQSTVAKTLAQKSINAIKEFENLALESNKTFVLSGGVAANLYIRSVIENAISQFGFTLVCPPPSLCTDNAAMIAWAGIERLKLGLINTLDFCPRARWSLEEL